MGGGDGERTHEIEEKTTTKKLLLYVPGMYVFTRQVYICFIQCNKSTTPITVAKITAKGGRPNEPKRQSMHVLPPGRSGGVDG